MQTLKAKKAVLQDLIDRQPYDTLLSEHDAAVVNEVTGWNFCFYKRVRNPEFKTDTRCIANSSDGSTFNVWSWNKAIIGASNNLTQAMRAAIKEQMAEHKQTAASVCVACGTKEVLLLTVDHKQTPFKKIAEAFCQEHTAVELANDSTGSGWYIKDAEVLSSWQMFHKNKADYQILCRSCNSKKGTKNDTN